MTCEDRRVLARPSRRLVLSGALTLSAATLTGCGVRLEDDAPDIPFVPTRDPIPGEAVLLAMLGALEADDAKHADARASRLRDALEDAQVPAKVLDGAEAPEPGAETVAAFEGAVRDCGPGLLKLVAQLTATQRIVANGATTDLWTTPELTRWKASTAAVGPLKATRATVYALELIAARASGGVSTSARAAGRELQGLVNRQTTAAADDAPAVTLGYDIPHDLNSTKARDLGTTTFDRLLAAYAGALDGLGSDRSAALEVIQWMVTAERVSRRAFPLPVPQLYGDPPTTS